MKQTLFALIVLVVVWGCAPANVNGPTQPVSDSLSAQSSPGTSQSHWPDLTILQNYPNPTGNSCSWDGTTSKGQPETGDKALENEHKNRFRLPTHSDPVKLNDVIMLPPNGDANDQERGVTVAGYVRNVMPGGTMGEACNCQEKTASLCDAHIEIVLDPANNDPSGHGVVIVEVTERSRRLAQQGLLPSNIGNDWSTKLLQDPARGILHKWVRLTGWLFFDVDHIHQDWQSDPNDQIHPANKPNGDNWRETCWEMHPVMGIEVLPSKPGDAG